MDLSIANGLPRRCLQGSGNISMVSRMPNSSGDRNATTDPFGGTPNFGRIFDRHFPVNSENGPKKTIQTLGRMERVLNYALSPNDPDKKINYDKLDSVLGKLINKLGLSSENAEAINDEKTVAIEAAKNGDNSLLADFAKKVSGFKNALKASSTPPQIGQQPENPVAPPRVGQQPEPTAPPSSGVQPGKPSNVDRIFEEHFSSNAGKTKNNALGQMLKMLNQALGANGLEEKVDLDKLDESLTKLLAIVTKGLKPEQVEAINKEKAEAIEAAKKGDFSLLEQFTEKLENLKEDLDKESSSKQNDQSGDHKNLKLDLQGTSPTGSYQALSESAA